MTTIVRPSFILLAVYGSILSRFPLVASEAYVLRFSTDILYVNRSACMSAGWQAELLFHNATTVPKTVRLLGATAGTDRPTGQLLIQPGRTLSTRTFEGSQLGGDPFGFVLVVNKLEIPDGVVVSSRADLYGPPAGCGIPPAAMNHSFGSVPLPVIRSLAGANERQILLATDLGIYPRRTNVIIYNAGSAMATARIELRVGCDDSLISERLVAIGPNSVIQVTGLTDEVPERLCSSPGTTPFTRYVAVTVDQPSFSHATTISNEFPVPTIGVTVSSQ